MVEVNLDVGAKLGKVLVRLLGQWKVDGPNGRDELGITR